MSGGVARSAPSAGSFRPGGVRLAVLLGGLWTLVLLACGEESITSIEVRGLDPIDPVPRWADVYADVEECTGVAGDFERVRWFRADSIADPVGEPSGGAWLVGEGLPHGIALLDRLLADGSPEQVDAVVRHESIHEVLQLGRHRGRVWCRCDGRAELFPQCD